mmetsp:Transcript_59551/g.128858  ORF Transcript_59551/g.128858 Transcript_59551/m.128858 type:complete len:307 (-) Transcript_59551:1346-2266(-)
MLGVLGPQADKAGAILLCSHGSVVRVPNAARGSWCKEHKIPGHEVHSYPGTLPSSTCTVQVGPCCAAIASGSQGPPSAAVCPLAVQRLEWEAAGSLRLGADVQLVRARHASPDSLTETHDGRSFRVHRRLLSGASGSFPVASGGSIGSLPTASPPAGAASNAAGAAAAAGTTTGAGKGEGSGAAAATGTATADCSVKEGSCQRRRGRQWQGGCQRRSRRQWQGCRARCGCCSSRQYCRAEEWRQAGWEGAAPSVLAARRMELVRGRLVSRLRCRQQQVVGVVLLELERRLGPKRLRRRCCWRGLER